MSTQTRQNLSTVMQDLDKAIADARAHLSGESEPKAQALLETTAEVLIGLKKAYEDYQKGSESAWQ